MIHQDRAVFLCLPVGQAPCFGRHRVFGSPCRFDERRCRSVAAAGHAPGL